jgi:hypothetical protein
MEMTKKASRTAYMREHHKTYYLKMKRVTLTLSRADYARFKEQAAAHGLPLAVYLTSLAFVAVNGKPLISKNAENNLTEIIGQLRRIGTNINQIARHANTVHKLTFGEARDVKNNLRELEDRITAFLKDPSA